jgi:hypothetical protein
MTVVLAFSACGTNQTATRSGSTTDTSPGAILLACGSDSVFPVSALSRPTGAEQGSDPAAVALRDVFTQGFAQGQQMDQYQDWIKVVATSDRVAFLGTLGGGPGHMLVELERHDGQWRYRSSGACALEVQRPGLTTARWALDPIAPAPTATDTKLHVIVNDPECNDGVQLDPKRVHPPTVTFTAKAVSIGYYVDSVSPGLHTCPGPIGAPGRPDIMGIPVVVDLGQPLGTRQVLDATQYPPAPARTTTDP